MADKEQRSIHPRNWRSTKDNERAKHNTSGTRKKPGRIERSIAAIETHIEQHPNDAMSLSRLSKLKGMV